MKDLSTENNSIGTFTKRTTCRFCSGQNLSKVLDLGNVPLAGGFLKENDFIEEKYFPLTLDFCQDCYLVQVSNVVSADTLFKENYFFFSSTIATLVTHFKDYAKDVYDEFFKTISNPSILEIGCNDGVLLKPFSELGVKTIGVDPATNVVSTIDIPGAIIYNNYFTEKLAKDIIVVHGKVDAVVSNFSFAHIDDMDDVVKGIKVVLKDDGLFIFEIYYLGTLLDEMNYDMIYHEHMSYYSVITLMKFFNKYSMEIFDVKNIPGVRTGSVRFFARNIGQRDRKVSLELGNMLKYEIMRGFDKTDVYQQYSKDVNTTRNEIISLLKKLKSEGKTIIGYGASGRGTIIMNYCGIDGQYIDYVVDDAPQKWGYFTPGTHVPIKSWDFVGKSKFPDYIVLFAWAFAEEVLEKRKAYIEAGGKFILPLPHVSVYPN
jgi:methylation protein EvaC